VQPSSPKNTSQQQIQREESVLRCVPVWIENEKGKRGRKESSLLRTNADTFRKRKN